jgi:hypothetical protein
MAREPKPHPETDPTGKTIEFEPIPPPEYVWLEATRDDEVRLIGTWGEPIEIRIGQTGETRPFLLDRGTAYRELFDAIGVDHHFSTYILVQPDVMEEDARRGWLIIPYGETISVGRADTPQFQLGRDIARKGHMQIENMKSRPTKRAMRIECGTDNPVKVRVKSDFMYVDHRVHW